MSSYFTSSLLSVSNYSKPLYPYMGGGHFSFDTSHFEYAVLKNLDTVLIMTSDSVRHEECV